MPQLGNTLCLAIVVTISGIGCSRAAGLAAADLAAADLAFCVQDINRYRAQVNRAPLAESSALEAFAAQGAQIDATAGVTHQHFSSTNGGGVALGENEMFTTNLQLFATLQGGMHGANARFWAEGPGGDHHDRLASTTYTQVGCGVYIAGGRVTVVEDFR